MTENATSGVPEAAWSLSSGAVAPAMAAAFRC